jgi:GNAT superfamily N-acetyltransferase
MECLIREAAAADAETLLHLIDALADYEHLPRPDEEARSRIVQHAFGPARYLQALLVESSERPVGYAIYFFTYSTFLARPSLYLEDIFVLPQERKHGYGMALMKHLARVALEAGCGRLEWQVLDWNQLAIGFYERLGAKRLHEWLPYRMTREDMARLVDNQG